ncbi:MAG: glycosyltransferase [Flavipsychrobacter sp.]|nr:glycosyltransferase [Flavipsychrobacter sp.]
MQAGYKMLMLGTFKTGALENYFVNGFLKLGYEVEVFNIELDYKNVISKIINRISPRFLLKELNDKVVQLCRKKKTDVIFICKGMSLFPETIEEIKKYTRLIVNYNPDHPYEFYSRGSGNKFIESSVKHYNVFFSYSKNISVSVQEKYGVDSYCIPFGYDSNTIDKYALDYNDEYKDSFLFFGAWDEGRSSFLNNVKRNDLEIFGDPEWKTKTTSKEFIQQNFQNRKLYGSELYQKIKSYAGVINLLRQQNLIEASHNMRTFEVPGYGGLLISQFTEEQASFFTPDVEAIYFTSPVELDEKMEFLKNNDQVVLEIKKNALNRSSRSGYSYDERCKSMGSIFDKYL